MFVTGGTLTGCSLPSSVAGRGSPGRTVDPFINKYVIEGKANVVAAVVVLNWLVLCTRGLPNIVYFIVGLYSQLRLEQFFSINQSRIHIKTFLFCSGAESIFITVASYQV